MQGQTVRIASQVIRYIEDHLHDKLDLDMVAAALHYSKYHLHRIFAKAVGLTIHEYVKRQQPTEAAKLLVFSEKPTLGLVLSVLAGIANIVFDYAFIVRLKMGIKGAALGTGIGSMIPTVIGTDSYWYSILLDWEPHRHSRFGMRRPNCRRPKGRDVTIWQK